MKLTKKLFCLALVLALTFALCACGKKDKENGTAVSTNPGGFSNPSSSPVEGTPSSTAADEGNLEGDVHFNDATLAW